MARKEVGGKISTITAEIDIEALNMTLLRLFYRNFNGILSKLDGIKGELLDHNYDIICGTETKLEDRHVENFCPQDCLFNIHRKDRDLTATGRYGGGG